MSVSPGYLQYVLEQLADLGRVTPRRMFGAVGLYCDGLFFGLISDDTLYFKVDDTNRADYVARGVGQFRPYRDKPDVSMAYYEVPADALEDGEECVLWARRSLAVATASTQQSGRRARASKPRVRRARRKRGKK